MAVISGLRAQRGASAKRLIGFRSSAMDRSQATSLARSRASSSCQLCVPWRAWACCVGGLPLCHAHSPEPWSDLASAGSMGRWGLERVGVAEDEATAEKAQVVPVKAASERWLSG